MTRAKKEDVSASEPEPEVNAYRVLAAEGAGRARGELRGATPEVIVFAAAVAAPLVLAAVRAVPSALRIAGLDPLPAARVLHGARVWMELAEAVVSMVLVLGARGLTEAGGREAVSDELRAITRLATIANAVAFSLVFVTFVRTDITGWDFFASASDASQNVAEGLVALVAARHFTREGSRLGARAGQALGGAMMVAVVLQWALTRSTRDDMFNTVPPQHADLVPWMAAGLWLGKLLVFGALCVVRGRRAEVRAPQKRRPRSH